MLVRVYIQSALFPDIKLVEIDGNATIDDLKQATLTLLPVGIDTSELALTFEEEDDTAVPKYVKDLGHQHGVRAHIHWCKFVEVEVRFGSETASHKFSPATTVGRVREWSGRKLGMKPEDIAEHVLQLADSDEQPDVDVHVGSLTSYGECSVIFDLVPAHRING